MATPPASSCAPPHSPAPRDPSSSASFGAPGRTPPPAGAPTSRPTAPSASPREGLVGPLRPGALVPAPDAGEARRAQLRACYATLDRIRLSNGLYLASPSADYSKAWLRDNVYEALPYADKPGPEYERTCWTLLDILRRHEWKVDAILREKPVSGDAYIHARFHPETLREFHEPWGNKQNDATGAILFMLAEGMRHGKRVLRDARDERLVGKMVRMLGAIEYWSDADNGMWEEWEEVHASSVGACVGGLVALQRQGWDVPDDLVQRGRWALDALLPRESEAKRVDLALLSVCWPYRDVVTPGQRERIVRNVEKHLLRQRGVVRYEGDSYYSTLAEEHGRGEPRSFYHGTEAEWTFGLPWLSLVHRQMGDASKADGYLRRALDLQTAPGELPELYYSKTGIPNPNTPLGWSVAMLILALEAAQ